MAPPAILCFDVEPDARLTERSPAASFAGFDRLLPLVPELRDRLTEASGAPAYFTWALRMDPQIAETYGTSTYVAERFGTALVDLARDGDELGIHTHMWRWDEALGTWVAEYASTSWVEHCLGSSLEAFTAAFASDCRVHRAGGSFLSEAMIEQLSRAGVEVDLTVEPGSAGDALFHPEEHMTGHIPDYSDVPTTPYRPSAADLRRPDPDRDDGVFLIPLTTALAGAGRRVTVTPHHETSRFAALLSGAVTDGSPVLAFVLRSDFSLYPDLPRFLDNLELIAQSGVQFMTATLAVEAAGLSLARS